MAYYRYRWLHLETVLQLMQDGANSLSFNSSKNATFSGHVTASGTNNFYVGDNGKFVAGASDDLQIYHDGSNSFIKNTTNDLYLDTASGSIHFTNGGTSEVMASFNTDGSVTLRHDNSTKFTTTSTGIDVTGTAVVDGLTSSGAVTSTSGSNSFGGTTFTSGITIAGLTSSAAVTSTTSNSNAFGGTNFTGTVSVNGNTLSDTSRNVYTNNISAAGNVTVTGNLVVNGTTTTLNTATLNVEDKNITLNYGTGDTSSSANGSGITIQDAEDSSTDATILWSAAGNNFNVSHSWNTLGYLQHTGVLYSRNNLLVLNSAGNGWNTWATRSNGNFNLNVGSIQTAGTILANNAGADKKFRWLRTGGNAFSLEHDASGYYFWNETTSDLLMRFTNAGNVGIGVNSPDQPLMVKGTIETQATNSTNGWQLYTHTDNTFRINYNGAGSDEVMIHSDGRVGVGTDSPVSGHKLTVNGKIGGLTYVDSYLQFDHSTGNTVLKANDDLIMGYNSGLRIRNSGKVGINEDGPFSLLHITRTATDAYTAGAFNNVPLLTLMHSNADTEYAGIRFTNTVGNYEHFLGSVQTGGNTADMVFQGYDRAGTTYKEYLRINDGGNVGIGTTNPANKLQIGSVGSTNYGGNSLAIGDGTRVFATFINPTTDCVEFYTNRKYAFLTSGSGGSGTGHVGIGTNNPLFKLHVSGTNTQIAIESTTTNQNSSLYYRAHGASQWETGVNITAGLDYEIYDRVNNASRMVVKHTGNVGIGVNPSNAKLEVVATSGEVFRADANSGAYRIVANQSGVIMNGNVGIGVKTSPLVKLDVKGSPSAPANSGTAQTGSLRVSQTAGNGVLDMGFYTSSNGTAWLQSTNKANLATNYDIALQPNGGNVGIGTDNPGNPLTVKAANCVIDAQSTADGQTIGFRAGYLNHTTLAGLFRYTTGDAQLYIDNQFIGNNGVYSDINFRNKSTTTNGSLINRLKIKGSTGHVGIGVTTPAHQLTVQHDTDPSIYIVGNGYNDTVRIGFGGGDVNNVMGNGNTGAIISSAQTTSGGAALGDLRFQINKGDNLQTALHISNQGFATFDHQGTDYGLAIKNFG